MERPASTHRRPRAPIAAKTTSTPRPRRGLPQIPRRPTQRAAGVAAREGMGQGCGYSRSDLHSVPAHGAGNQDKSRVAPRGARVGATGLRVVCIRSRGRIKARRMRGGHKMIGGSRLGACRRRARRGPMSSAGGVDPPGLHRRSGGGPGRASEEVRWRPGTGRRSASLPMPSAWWCRHPALRSVPGHPRTER